MGRATVTVVGLAAFEPAARALSFGGGRDGEFDGEVDIDGGNTTPCVEFDVVVDDADLCFWGVVESCVFDLSR